MKALLLTKPEGPKSPAITEVDTPVPGPGEVRVALKAAALNHRELWVSRGMYPGMQLPTMMGADGSGVIDAVGGNVDTSLIGKEVVLYPAAEWGDNPDYPSPKFGCLGMPYPGTFAEHICVPVHAVAAKPQGFTFEEAAGVPLAGLTAWRSLAVKSRLKAGEKVLITGIGGGVATWALKFAKALGAEVFVTSGSQDKIEQAIALGASGGVNYNEGKWGKALAKLSAGIDVVVDGAAASSVVEYSRALNMGARVVIYGSTGGMNFSMASTDLFLRHATLYGSAMGTEQDFADMMAFVDQHQLKPAIDKEFDLENATEALAYLEEEHGMGKVILRINP